MRDTIRAILAIILVASLRWSAAAQDSPLSPGETRIIEKARELALEYTANLPNFVCTETIRRSQLPRRSQTWKLLDTIAVDVAFSNQGERYNLLTINGKPTRKSFKEIGGKFFLPLHAQLNVTLQDGNQTRNEMEFGNYRKFSSEATLQFEPQ